MGSQLVVGVVIVASDGRLFQRPVHPLHLAICPGMIGLREPVLDVVLGTGVLEGMRPDRFPLVEGQPARPCYIDHVLMENRHGLVVDGGASLATATAERDAALELLDRRPASGRITSKRITLGAGKAYEVTQFVHDLRRRKVTPHIAINGHTTKTGKQRKTAIDGRTTRHAG